MPPRTPSHHVVAEIPPPPTMEDVSTDAISMIMLLLKFRVVLQMIFGEGLGLAIWFSPIPLIICLQFMDWQKILLCIATVLALLWWFWPSGANGRQAEALHYQSPVLSEEEKAEEKRKAAKWRMILASHEKQPRMDSTYGAIEEMLARGSPPYSLCWPEVNEAQVGMKKQKETAMAFHRAPLVANPRANRKTMQKKAEVPTITITKPRTQSAGTDPQPHAQPSLSSAQPSTSHNAPSTATTANATRPQSNAHPTAITQGVVSAEPKRMDAPNPTTSPIHPLALARGCLAVHDHIDKTYALSKAKLFAPLPPPSCPYCGYVSAQQKEEERSFMRNAMAQVHEKKNDLITECRNLSATSATAGDELLLYYMTTLDMQKWAEAVSEALRAVLLFSTLPATGGMARQPDTMKLQKEELLEFKLVGDEMESLKWLFDYIVNRAGVASAYYPASLSISEAKAFFEQWPATPPPPPPQQVSRDEANYARYGIFGLKFQSPEAAAVYSGGNRYPAYGGSSYQTGTQPYGSSWSGDSNAIQSGSTGMNGYDAGHGTTASIPDAGMGQADRPVLGQNGTAPASTNNAPPGGPIHGRQHPGPGTTGSTGGNNNNQSSNGSGAAQPTAPTMFNPKNPPVAPAPQGPPQGGIPRPSAPSGNSQPNAPQPPAPPGPQAPSQPSAPEPATQPTTSGVVPLEGLPVPQALAQIARWMPDLLQRIDALRMKAKADLASAYEPTKKPTWKHIVAYPECKPLCADINAKLNIIMEWCTMPAPGRDDPYVLRPNRLSRQDATRFGLKGQALDEAFLWFRKGASCAICDDLSNAHSALHFAWFTRGNL